jgi:hypothetical protein
MLTMRAVRPRSSRRRRTPTPLASRPPVDHVAAALLAKHDAIVPIQRRLTKYASGREDEIERNVEKAAQAMSDLRDAG